MALTVEDGTGLPAADAYISLAEFKAFCDDREYDWQSYDDVKIEASIRLATGWIDTYSRYKGSRLKRDQSLEFPREGLVDWSGHEVRGVPLRVKHACAELAFKGLSEPLYKDQERGGMITSESVGPISVTYAEGAPVGKVFQFAVNLLKPYVRDPDQLLYAGGLEPTTGPNFEIGMHDSPGIGAGFSSIDAFDDM